MTHWPGFDRAAGRVVGDGMLGGDPSGPVGNDGGLAMRAATCALAVGLGASAAAADVTFDFEEISGNRNRDAGDYSALTVEAEGIFAIVTRTSGERFTVWNSEGHDVPSAWGAKHLSPTFRLTEDDYLIMSFSEPLSSVTVEFGDYGQDHDLAEVYAYSEHLGEGELLDAVTGDMGESDMRWDDPTSLTVFAQPGDEIWSIRFRGGEDPFYQSTFIDNIVVNMVPTPGVLATMGLACAAAAHRLRRRSANAR